MNGTPITDRELAKLLVETSKLNPRPQLVLEVDPIASCSRVDVVRSLMNGASVCREGFCSEGRNPETWDIKGGP